MRESIRNYFNTRNEKLIRLIFWQQVFGAVWAGTKLSWWWQKLREDEVRILTCLSHVSNKVVLPQSEICTFVGVGKGKTKFNFIGLEPEVDPGPPESLIAFQWSPITGSFIARIFTYVSLERIVMWLNFEKYSILMFPYVIIKTTGTISFLLLNLHYTQHFTCKWYKHNHFSFMLVLPSLSLAG